MKLMPVYVKKINELCMESHIRPFPAAKSSLPLMLTFFSELCHLQLLADAKIIIVLSLLYVLVLIA